MFRYDGIMLPPTADETNPSVFNKIKKLVKSFYNKDMIAKYKHEIYESMFYNLNRIIEDNNNELYMFNLLVINLSGMLSGMKTIFADHNHIVEKVRVKFLQKNDYEI